MREAFEERFKQILDGGRVEVVASQAVTTHRRPSYPAKKTDTLFRWVGNGKDSVGGELHWTSLTLGKGAVFNMISMCPPECASFADDYTLQGALRWFDDHPDCGDGGGIVANTRQMLAYDNGDLLPLALTLELYFALELEAPGLLAPILLANPVECSFADASSAKMFLKRRKEAAKQAAKFATKLFGDVPLTHTEAMVGRIAKESFKLVEGERTHLRAK